MEESAFYDIVKRQTRLAIYKIIEKLDAESDDIMVPPLNRAQMDQIADKTFSSERHSICSSYIDSLHGGDAATVFDAWVSREYKEYMEVKHFEHLMNVYDSISRETMPRTTGYASFCRSEMRDVTDYLRENPPKGFSDAPALLKSTYIHELTAHYINNKDTLIRKVPGFNWKDCLKKAAADLPFEGFVPYKDPTSIQNMTLSYSNIFMANKDDTLYIGAAKDSAGYKMSDEFAIVIDTDIDAYTALKNRVTGENNRIASGDYSSQDMIINITLIYSRDADLEKDMPVKALASKVNPSTGELETFDFTDHMNKDEFLKCSVYAEKAMEQSGIINTLNKWKAGELTPSDKSKETTKEPDDYTIED